MKKICVLGLGYIGLPTASILCEQGYYVTGVDTDLNVLKKIKEYKFDENEPLLHEMVKKSIISGRLSLKEEPQESDIYIICTPTPVKFEGSHGIPDLTYVFSAIDNIIGLLKPNNSLIIESTIPVGTTNKIKNYVVGFKPALEDMCFAHCPERVLPGNIIFELKNNSRIIGGISPQNSTKIANFFKTFVNGKIIETNAETAEMCKLTENSFRDVNIAFANELSIICDNYDINVKDLINIANLHPRVNILDAGIGVGGHCIPVDPWFLINSHKSQTKLLQSARKVNTEKTNLVVSKISKNIKIFISKNKKIPIISFLGLSYKPNSNDIRDSPALIVINTVKLLLDDCFLIDPYVKSYLGVETVDLDKALKKSDIVIKLVNHSVFASIKHENKYIYLDYSRG